MRFAFFDLDKTLIAVNSASLWVKAELRAGNVSPWAALRAMGWLTQYHLGAADITYALRQSIASIKGTSARVLANRTLEFFEAEVKPRYRPGALAALDNHRRQGDHIALLTSSTSYLAEPVAGDLGLDGYLCTHLQVDKNGHFTGEPHEPLAFGEGKVALARAYLERHGAALDDCVFYSDSASDIPMLEAAGTAVAVNPDPRLKREAKSRGWVLQDWGRPRPERPSRRRR